MTMQIPLGGGRVALVDAEDYDRVMAAGRWQARDHFATVYAERSHRTPDGPRKVGLHTFLTGWPLVDHRNGNGLDNRRSNLRPATKAQNAQNRRVSRNSTSGFKGVGWHKGKKKWEARIRSAGQLHRLGTYSDPQEAARAYDEAAREIFGEFAALNFPRLGERSAA